MSTHVTSCPKSENPAPVTRPTYPVPTTAIFMTGARYHASPMSDGSALVLVITPLRGAHSVRLTVTKRITSIGSDATADVRLPTAPPHWAVVHRADAGVDVSISSSGQRQKLAPGQTLEADGITLALESTAAARD